jgi:GNAT superfamily N-acetyltransferase
MTYSYWRAKAEDGEACAAIIHEWDTETQWIGPLDDIPALAAWWSGRLGGVPTSWGCERDGQVVGFCLREDDNIGGLYLARDARGHGAGKALLDLAKQDRD